MTNNQDKVRKIAAEAAIIVRELEEDPKNPDLIRKRDAFIARGPAEKRIFLNIERGWAGTAGRLKGPNRSSVFVIFGAVLVGLVLAWEPLRLAFLADHKTALLPQSITLDTGENATLDATSAIATDSDEQSRSVRLLRGSAFFDVQQDGRPFTVTAGDIEVSVIGTSFEVALNGATVQVSVVSVRDGTSERTLAEGKKLRFEDEITSVREVNPEEVASWRGREFRIDGLRFGEVVASIDRRLSGRIVVLGSRLENAEVAGVIDLTDPENALQALSAASGASVLKAGGFLTIVYPR